MSVLRWRAKPTSSESRLSGSAPGSSVVRLSLINSKMRASSAGSCVFGSGGGAVAQPAHISASKAAIVPFTLVPRLLQDFEQAGRAHSRSDAHRHDAIFGFTPASLDQEMAGH